MWRASFSETTWWILSLLAWEAYFWCCAISLFPSSKNRGAAWLLVGLLSFLFWNQHVLYNLISDIWVWFGSVKCWTCLNCSFCWSSVWKTPRLIPAHCILFQSRKQLRRHRIHLQPCCAKTGEGVMEGMDFLTSFCAFNLQMVGADSPRVRWFQEIWHRHVYVACVLNLSWHSGSLSFP